MKSKKYIYSLKPLVMVFALMALFSSCKDDEPELADPPTAADAAFTYTPSSQTDNIIEFRASNQNVQAFWELGNGNSAEGPEAVGIYPNAGTYTVTLTIFNQGGSISSSQDVVIENDDPSLLDNPLFDLLTGGADGPGSKSWVIDSTTAGHFGVGPNPSPNGDFPAFYAASPLEKSGSGMYSDVYTFYLQGFQFDMITNGLIYLNTEHTGDWPEAYENEDAGDYSSPFPDQLGDAWSLSEGADTTISIIGESFIGYYTGVRSYKIVTIEENLLFLRVEDSQSPDLAWYFRLIPEGFDPGNEVSVYNLPLDFETEEPEMTVFGNSTVTYVDNPDPSVINNSSRVLETVHGNEPWAGFYVNLEDPLDFSAENTITLKVWAPLAGTFRLKLEQQTNANNFVEVDLEVTEINTWQEVSFDFSGSEPVFDRIVFFPGWDVPNAGTFYLDDVTQQ